ncbi:MAG TPA: hypothetical protein VNX66_11130 [Candidatus Sulfotelmatobacter sp.]|nr:hypothetical protein [Candidatus Sulfotelmatobacter sp.]
MQEMVEDLGEGTEPVGIYLRSVVGLTLQILRFAQDDNILY